MKKVINKSVVKGPDNGSLSGQLDRGVDTKEWNGLEEWIDLGGRMDQTINGMEGRWDR